MTCRGRYRPNLRALAVYLVVYQHVPVQRCAELIAEAFSPSVTEHRVWHLERLRAGSSGQYGHGDWHVLSRVIGN
jgi:hypothetical protein